MFYLDAMELVSELAFMRQLGVLILVSLSAVGIYYWIRRSVFRFTNVYPYPSGFRVGIESRATGLYDSVHEDCELGEDNTPDNLMGTGIYSDNKRLVSVYNYVRSLKLPLSFVLLLSCSIFVFRLLHLEHAFLDSCLAVSIAWAAIKLVNVSVVSRMVYRGAACIIVGILLIHLFGFSDEIVNLLESIDFSWNKTTVSLYALLKGICLLFVLFWTVLFASDVIDQCIHHSKGLTPSVKLLLSKINKIILLVVAVLLGLHLVGLDLTVFTVFSGAFGLGVGFGLQKIISNFISGIILLSDKSIKPGDVIGIGNTYGWVNSLGARYVSVITRDGKEHLIPNELLITEKVENWSFTNNDVRLRIPMRIAYDTDVHQAIHLILEVAYHIPRILNHPEPKCLVRAFGDFAIDLELRVWIDDPANGMGSVQSEVLLGVLDKFKEHGIKIPYPRYDVINK